MKSLMSIALLLMIAVAVAPVAHSEYYYGGDGQIPLRVDSGRVCIRFSDTIPQLQTIENLSRLETVEPDPNAIGDFKTVTISPGGDIYAFLDTLNNTTGIDAAEPYVPWAADVPSAP